ncbi:conserved hypothetical protein [Desulfarculales bacterium]
MSCAEYKWCAQSQRKPNFLLASLWRWHTGWCPGGRHYQTQLAAQGQQPPDGQGGTGVDQPRS